MIMVTIESIFPIPVNNVPILLNQYSADCVSTQGVRALEAQS